MLAPYDLKSFHPPLESIINVSNTRKLQLHPNKVSEPQLA